VNFLTFRHEQIMQVFDVAYPYPLCNKGLLEAIRFALLHEPGKIPWAGPAWGGGVDDAALAPSAPL
jgi:hypothetical protein